MQKYLASLFDIKTQLMYVLNRKQKIQAIGIIFLLLVGALLETLGVSAILPLIQVLLDIDSVMKYDIVKWWVELFDGDPAMILFVSMAVMIGIVYFIKNMTLLFISKIKISFRWSLQSGLSKRMFNSYLKRPYVYFLNANSAKVMRGVIADVNSVYTVLESFFNIIAELLTILSIYIFLCVTDFFMATVILCVLAILGLGILLVFKKILDGAGNKHRAVLARQNKCVLQAVNGIKEINVMGRKNYFEREYADISDQLKVISANYNFLNECPNRIIETVSIVVIMIVVGIKLVSGVSVTTFIPTLAVFAVGVFRILPYVAQIVSQVNGLVFYCPGLAATYKNLHEAEEYAGCQLIKREEKTMLTFNHEISVKNLWWNYPMSDKQVLKDVSFDINKGEAVALIGSSGSGKTTLVDCILGVLIPEKGSIYVDGNCVWNSPEAWSKLISYVPQNVFLADDTIRHNIAFGIDEKEIDDEKIWYALEQAQLKEVVENLPQGIETVVGERGIRFSGGQRQRMAIARALYYDPQILVLDEATSALDHETETAVMQSIEQLHKKKTLIISAHRLSTIEKCDKIYRIKDGQIECVDKAELFET